MKNTNKIGLIGFLLILVTLAVSSFTIPKNEKVKEIELKDFWYSWDDAMKKAQKENKMILVDAYTTWCGWCTKMEKDTYAKDSIQKLINANFVPVKINPEVTNVTYKIGSKSYTGRELLAFLASGKSYNSYPMTYFWLDPSKETDGKRKYLQSGYQNPANMSLLLRRVIEIKGN